MAGMQGLARFLRVMARKEESEQTPTHTVVWAIVECIGERRYMRINKFPDAASTATKMAELNTKNQPFRLELFSYIEGSYCKLMMHGKLYPRRLS